LEAQQVTDEAIQNVRNICGTLRPQALDDLGLVAALTWHFKTFGARSNLQVDFEHNSVDEGRINPLLQSTIFRVIQEAITNIARHARTDRASVVLWMTDTDVVFRVKDRGKGFKPADVRGNHSGLANIRERVGLVNGHCDIKSSPGRGTIVQVQLPILNQPESTTSPNSISTSTPPSYGTNNSR
jgi:signal transduction histidine kinase